MEEEFCFIAYHIRVTKNILFKSYVYNFAFKNNIMMEVFKFNVFQSESNIHIEAIKAFSIDEAENHVIDLLRRYVNTPFEPTSETEYGKVYLVRNEMERTFKLIIGGVFNFLVQVQALSENNKKKPIDI
jgi:hypothetical protein